MEPVRTGLIGFGGRGGSLAESLDDAEGIDFRAVCDQVEERAAEAERSYDVDAYTDADAFFDLDTIEAIVVITRAAGHAPLSVRAMEAGKHVLCTKPLARNVAEAREMVAAAQRTGRKGAVDFQNRFAPHFWSMKEAAAQLDPIQVLITNQRRLFLDRYLRPGYAYGILDSASHRIDLANWLMDREPVAVSGTVRYGTFTDEEAIDTISIHVEYTDDRTASLTASMGGSGLEGVCQVLGKEGTAQPVEGEDIKITDVEFSEDFGEQKERQRTNSRRTPIEGPGQPATTAMVGEFARYVRGATDDPAVATFEDGYDALLIAKAAVQSHETGDTVHLSELREEISTV